MSRGTTICTGILTAAILGFGCGIPVPLEVKDVCRQPIGTSVEVIGYVSPPNEFVMLQQHAGGAIKRVGLQLNVMTRPDATGDAVKSTFWTTTKGEPNMLQQMPMSGYEPSDLLIYTSDGQKVGPGKKIKVSGETVADGEAGCYVDVSLIEVSP